ncbi:MAG: GNAT family N-acetyltransferase [Nakamurella sp.]
MDGGSAGRDTRQQHRAIRWEETMLELIPPTVRLRDAWWEAHAEWGPGTHEDGFGLQPSDDVHTTGGFIAWLHRLDSKSGPGRDGQTRDRAILRWIVEDDRVLGGVALRHGPEQYVQWAGHIGFGVRPSERRRGIATWALGRILDLATEQGMKYVRLVCAADNLASAATIEHYGAVLETIVDSDDGPARRYGIQLR